MSESDAQLGRRLWGIADAVEHCTDLAIDDVQAIRDAAHRLESRPSTSGQEISEEMVERAAIALAWQNFAPQHLTPEKSWRSSAFSESLRDEYRKKARAALQAAAQKG